MFRFSRYCAYYHDISARQTQASFIQIPKGGGCGSSANGKRPLPESRVTCGAILSLPIPARAAELLRTFLFYFL
jgi:hypothetical protein